MGKLYLGNRKHKIYLGNKKIKRAYLGTNSIYSAGNIVTYIVGDSIYQEEMYEGESVLNPKTFTPSIIDKTFLGWSMSHDSTNIITSMVMEEEPVTLYGVFKVKDIVLTQTSYGSGDSSNYIAGPFNVDPNKYTFWLYTANYGVWERSGAYSDLWQGRPRYSESQDKWMSDNGAICYGNSWANAKEVGEKNFVCPDDPQCRNLIPRPNTYVTYNGSNNSYAAAKLVAVGKTIVA